MNNSAHPTPHSTGRPPVLDGPAISYDLDRGEAGNAAPASYMLDDAVASSGGLERVWAHLARPDSTDDPNFYSPGLHAPSCAPCGKLQRRLLQRVLDRMKADLATNLDLNTLAAESGYSRSHFLRTFRAFVGCSPHQCLTRMRVEKAKHILRKESASLIDIALDCGFSSHAHFSNTFRQIVGLAPSEYRRTYTPRSSHPVQGATFNPCFFGGSE
jgi:AraC-like DNA-binding protein